MRNSLKSKLKRLKSLILKTYKSHKPIYIDHVKVNIKNKDKNKVWAFCAGQYSNDFRGNPKYLFIYVNKYRKDIDSYWLCDDLDTIKFVRKLGYKAYRLGTKQAEIAINKTGVLVSEQVKQVIPEGLENAKYINLWHGVGGVKNVERSIKDGRILDEISKKYIKNNSYFRQNEMYLAPSKFIEEIAIKQLGLKEENIIRAGYPRCIYQTRCEKFKSYDIDFIKNRDLPSDTKLIAYVPTYRNEKNGDFLIQAIPDIEKLIEVCEKNHFLFIFKMHPILENEIGFLKMKEKYSNCKWLLFWNNKDDFYEIIANIDLCIMDFSSIYTDFVALGVKHYVRYLFDNDTLNLEFPMDYDKTTLGHKCYSFDELIDYLPKFEDEKLEKKIQYIKNLYWEYSDEHDFDRIIDSIIDFKRVKSCEKKLYSFDIFDTLISRKVLMPIGIHYYVKEQMEKSDLNFPNYLVKNYPKIRQDSELNVREYYVRTKIERNSLKVEIQFDEIFERIKCVYNLTDQQINFLKEQELKIELENVIPLTDRINEVKELIKKGEEVILVSDMYLPKDFIKKMLEKADPTLCELELFLSSEYGYQKADKTLFIEVYKKYGEGYDFLKWIHTGDNPKSDNSMPKSMFIENNKVDAIEFNDYELDIVEKLQSYDSYLIAASMARFRHEHPNIKEQFVYSYISLLFVPYIYWAIHHAKEDKDEIIYFVSRDGHQLKKIGEVINEYEKLNLDLRYMYASRKTWRVPSFIDHIDIDFWGQGHGNFSDVTTYKKLLSALSLDEKKFVEFFPELEDLKNKKKFTTNEIIKLTEIFQSSKKYEDYLLNYAKEKRESVCGYLKETIDSNKQFSIIEYWGRGYTQENFTRLWNEVIKKKQPSKFYYSRSTLPSDEYNIRYNYVVNPEAQQFIESIFACIDYKSITNYEKVNKKWKPIIVKQKCDYVLFRSMEEFLPEFTKMYCSTDFVDRDKLGRELIDFAISYYTNNPAWSGFVQILSELEDSVQLYGESVQFAKELTMNDMRKIRFNKVKINDITKNAAMSLAKSNNKVKEYFYDLYQTEDKNQIITTKKYKRYEIRKSKLCQKELNKEKNIAIDFSKLYKKSCKINKLENKIVIFVNNNFKSNYKTLVKQLEQQKDFVIKYIDLKNKNYKKIAEELSKSKYIIMEEPFYLLSEIKLRDNSYTIILSSSALSYFTKGLCKKSLYYTEEKLIKYRSKMNVSILCLPSINSKEFYQKIYSTNVDTKYLYDCSPITDCYFDKKEIDLAKKRVNSLINLKGRKVIGYINFKRYRNETSQYIQCFNLNDLKHNLGTEYVVLIINLNNDKVNYVGNNFNIRGFSKDVTNKISIRQLMIASDVIVGDYCDTLLEAPILNKPVYISKWGKDDVESSNDTLIKLEKNPYGKIIRSTEELITNIKNDLSNEQIVFKEKYYDKINGTSSAQIIELIKSNK